MLHIFDEDRLSCLCHFPGDAFPDADGRAHHHGILQPLSRSNAQRLRLRVQQHNGANFGMHRRHGAMQHDLQDFFNIGDTGDEFRDLTQGRELVHEIFQLARIGFEFGQDFGKRLGNTGHLEQIRASPAAPLTPRFPLAPGG